MKKKELEALIDERMRPPYEIDIKPTSWIMANRARFIPWIDKTFKRKHKIKKEASCKKVSHVGLFPHQSFIKDYMQFASPYRGLLLYHGIGVGKTFSSIASAEILLNYMNVMVMLPASLHDNYVSEIKKYGAKFYTPKQHWRFVSANSVSDKMLRIMKLKTTDGIWVPFPNEEPNFWDLDASEQAEITKQIDTMIHNAFEIVHYNGLDLKKIEAMTEKGNPFDNKCVIIDEIHNLISMVVNKGKIGIKIYKLLMAAKGLKLIMLSGTPVINYPTEIAFLINLVTGPRTMYEIKFVKEGTFDPDAIRPLLEANKYIDNFEIDGINRKVFLSFLPEGFSKIGEGEVARESYVRNKEETLAYANLGERVKLIIESMKEIGMRPWKVGGKNEYFTEKTLMTLPEEEDDFDAYFVDYESEIVKNPRMFMRRILGAVSFYSTYSPELYPDVNIMEVPLKMSNFHFAKYEKSRDDERKQEKRNAKNKGKQTIFSKQTQVYKAFSRAICNFVFPEGIERPFPSKLKQMRKELDEDELFDDIDEDKLDVDAEYKKAIKSAIDKLKVGNYLTYNEIEKYSPKYKYIYDRMHEVQGPVLIYSQFRTVEGLNLFQCFLEKNGYEELRAKRVKDEWKFEGTSIDRPKYVVFTGNNDETRMLLRIFNKDPDLPHFDIKAIMITKSGAEGISLKNVRQVHILEPYWNYIRIEQVIGRAVRTCSHIDLPAEERNVTVYIYYMKATQQQLVKSRGIKVQDRGLTSDEHIYMIAKKKDAIIKSFLDLMKRASVDCALNAEEHGGIKCFAFPTNIRENKMFFVNNIAQETLNAQYTNEVEEIEWTGHLVKTNQGLFLLHEETGNLYDWEIYDASNRLLKVGSVKGTSQVV